MNLHVLYLIHVGTLHSKGHQVAAGRSVSSFLIVCILHNSPQREPRTNCSPVLPLFRATVSHSDIIALHSISIVKYPISLQLCFRTFHVIVIDIARWGRQAEAVSGKCLYEDFAKKPVTTKFRSRFKLSC